ncbi:MAG: DUF4142 domain-containing protein [Gemmatimonadaceae bacterium]|nr:DUF4142 domain-containing protein [Gloeobacterales cyanobacterium ES-bin-141]
MCISVAPVTAQQDQMMQKDQMQKNQMQKDQMQKDQSTMMLRETTTTLQGPPVSELDARFINDIHLGNKKEVALSNMALQKATSSAIKQYAQQMIDYHKQSDGKIVQLAQMQKVNLPEGPSTSMHSVMDRLSALSGSSFDKAYMDELVEDHNRNVYVYRMQAERGTDNDVRAFATQSLPEIESHLASARSISQQVASK